MLTQDPEISSRPSLERLEGCFLTSVQDGVAIIGVASESGEAWLADRAGSTLASLLTGILGKPVSVKFEVLHPDLIDNKLAKTTDRSERELDV